MSLVEEVGPGLDGLSQLRALMNSGRKPGILVSLNFDFIEIESGRAVFAGTPGEHAYNPIGTVHGGYAATLLRRNLAGFCLWLRRAFAALGQSGLYDAGTESRLPQSNYSKYGIAASGGPCRFVWQASSVCRGKSDRFGR